MRISCHSIPILPLLLNGAVRGWEAKNPSFEEGNGLGSEMASWTRYGSHPEWIEVFVGHAGIEPRTGHYCIGSYSGLQMEGRRGNVFQRASRACYRRGR